VLGLGLMGSGMAHSLIRAGFAVTVYNREASKAAPLGEVGARIALSPRAAAADAEAIVSMVADDHASRSVWMGEQGASASVTSGALLIESSTLTVEWIEELAAAARQVGAVLIDAPVTGSKDDAAAGQVLFLAGGSAAAVERAGPVPSAMGRDVVHLEPTGGGALLELVNNFMCGVQAAVLAEALTLVAPPAAVGTRLA
jgi:3-hydroxyisobutyrate dehydrogenase